MVLLIHQTIGAKNKETVLSLLKFCLFVCLFYCASQDVCFTLQFAVTNLLAVNLDNINF